MRAIQVGSDPGRTLHWAEAADPELGSGQVLIRARATAVNRADLMQAKGLYPPPPGASEILGLECAGTVSELGAGVSGFAVGDRVMALLPGGGYAEQAVVPAACVMPVPERLSIEEALSRFGGNRSQAARSLGIARSTLRRKMAEHGIEDEPG